MILTINVAIVSFAVGMLVGYALFRRFLEAEERAHVQVGDLWERIGDNPRTRGLCEVVRANVNTEAGPDSWVMKRCDDGKTMYMHRRQRAEGKWILCMRGGRVMRRSKDVLHTVEANKEEREG